MTSATMQALNYLGPYKVRVEDVKKPKLEHPDDIIVKVTTVSWEHRPGHARWADGETGGYLWLGLAVSNPMGREIETGKLEAYRATACMRAEQQPSQASHSATRTWESWWRKVRA
jgi:hypothetical protein